MTAALDLTRQKFGRLIALRRAPNWRGRAMWFCICECGAEKIVRGSALTSGNSTSCGCGVREAMRQTGKGNRTHGQSRTQEYRAWARMLHRCYVDADIKYPLYGGRGITVCDQWRNSYETFLADMGQKPTPSHSLDRISSDGPYEPSNCRWATASEQNKNRRAFNRKRANHGDNHGCA